MPPLVGFYASWTKLQALISTNQAAYVWLAVIAVVVAGRRFATTCAPSGGTSTRF